MPSTSAAQTPSLAMSSAPGTAAMANSIDGRPVRIPTWVALRFISSWMIGMTGGTAKIVNRNAAPESHRSSNEFRSRARSGAVRSFMDALRIFMGRELLANQIGEGMQTRVEFDSADLKSRSSGHVVVFVAYK